MRAPAQIRRRSVAPLLIFIALAILGVALMIRGLDFYPLSLDARVEHDDFRVLSPTGLVGQGYGVFAGVLVLLNLAYLVRRRFPRLRVGSMSAWLHAHVFTGIAAGMLAVYHSAFQARSDLAVTLLVALGVVIGTGILGRFLRWLATSGDPEQLEASFVALDELQPGLGATVEHAVISKPVPPDPPGTGFISGVKALPEFLRVARQRRAAVFAEAKLAIKDPALAKMGKRIIRQTASLAAAEARGPGLTRLMSSWRALHRFFAILMVVAVLLHAGVAWYYGYRWIFEDSGEETTEAYSDDYLDSLGDVVDLDLGDDVDLGDDSQDDLGGDLGQDDLGEPE